MKLEKILIENFRGIERMELDFQDELGCVQNVVPIVGPNTTGKTTILDAITLCLGPGTELFTMRPELVKHMSPASIVRRGAVRARVECTVRFSDDELEKVAEIFVKTEHPDAGRIPHVNEVKVAWEYPDPTGVHARGRTWYSPNEAYLLFRAAKLPLAIWTA